MKVIQSLITIILFLHAGLVHALPEGTHIGLCLGGYESLEFFVESCGSTSSQSKPQALSGVSGYTDEHQGDCIDFQLGHASQGYNITSNEFRFSDDNNNSYSPSAFLARHNFFFQSSTFNSFQTLSPSRLSPHLHLKHIRTFVIQV